MAQILAVIIFVAMCALIVTEKIERHIVTLVCGLLVLVLVFGISTSVIIGIIATFFF